MSIYSGAGNLAASQTLTISDVTTQINLYSSQTGVVATANGGNLTLTSAEGGDIVVTQTVTLAAQAAPAPAPTSPLVATTTGTISLSASQNITVGGAEVGAIGFSAGSIALDTQTVANVNVLSASAANDAIQRADSALTTVSSLRSQFGAVQNRFESTISNLTTVSENLEASRSRIRDADFAAETAALTRAQILQQAGIAILAQANAAPQNVLGLLR